MQVGERHRRVGEHRRALDTRAVAFQPRSDLLVPIGAIEGRRGGSRRRRERRRAKCVDNRKLGGSQAGLRKSPRRYVGCVLALGEDASGEVALYRLHFDEARLRIAREEHASFEWRRDGTRVAVAVTIPVKRALGDEYGYFARWNVLAVGLPSGRTPR